MNECIEPFVLLDHEDPAVKAQVREYLAPHESHAMFILGNLRSARPTRLYAARLGGELVGVCGFYPTHRSLIPFSTERQVIRDLVAHFLSRHPRVDWMNGIDYCAEPAREVMLSMGHEPDNDPRQIFLELEGMPPEQPGEQACRLFCDEDAEQVALLLRALRPDLDPAAPVTNDELEKTRSNRARWVLVDEGRIVSTSATTGLGLRACQIIGVATDAAHRGRGFARAVCAKLVRSMAADGAETTVLFTNHNNAAARRCYEGLGFRVTGKYYVAKFKEPGRPGGDIVELGVDDSAHDLEK